MELDEVMQLVRQDVRRMHAYSSARSLHHDVESYGRNILYLDANENPVEPFPGGVELNRYQAQQPNILRDKMASIYKVEPHNIMMSRGSDEAIEVIIRTFCQPGGDDAILDTPPTFGMYAQHAALNATKVHSISLDPYDLSLNKDKVIGMIGPKTPIKVVFLCSPNNPTGLPIPMADLIEIIQKSHAMVVVDEAYIEYHDAQNLLQLLPYNPHVILLRTLSKARALAGLRLGCAIGHKDVIKMLCKVLPPYPMCQPVVDTAMRALSAEHQLQLENIRKIIVEERGRMSLALSGCLDVETVWPSATNFLLVQVKDPEAMMQKAVEQGIILRDMSAQIPRSIRITIGLPHENDRVLEAWGIKVQST